MRFCRALAVIGVVASLPALLESQTGGEWPQFRGPNRDGALASFAEPKAWPDRLTQKWKVEVGEGHASPILIGNRVYVFTRQGANEVMQAIDADTGKTIWQSRYAAPVKVNPAAEAHGPGPKSTPTFADGRIFTLGMGGIVSAFDAASGTQLWQKPGGSTLPRPTSCSSPSSSSRSCAGPCSARWLASARGS
jgi:outer membrane protein assembly factor BamB